MTNHPKLTQCTDSAAHGISSKKATGSRRPKKIMVRVSFSDGMREWRGYDSCSKWFAIAKPPCSRDWDIIHVPTGLCKRHCYSLVEARLFCGIYGALPVNWENISAWAKWQEKHEFLMPWFEASDQVMYAI